MKRGWYIYCPDCGATTFLAQWKWLAQFKWCSCPWKSRVMQMHF